jgi:hypothetical protein
VRRNGRSERCGGYDHSLAREVSAHFFDGAIYALLRGVVTDAESLADFAQAFVGEKAKQYRVLVSFPKSRRGCLEQG